MIVRMKKYFISKSQRFVDRDVSREIGRRLTCLGIVSLINNGLLNALSCKVNISFITIVSNTKRVRKHKLYHQKEPQTIEYFGGSDVHTYVWPQTY